MHDRHARVVRGLRAGQDRVGVPLDQDGRRALPREQRAELLHHPADLDMTRLAADTGQGRRGGEPGGGEEYARQFLVGVLTTVD